MFGKCLSFVKFEVFFSLRKTKPPVSVLRQKRNKLHEPTDVLIGK